MSSMSAGTLTAAVSSAVSGFGPSSHHVSNSGGSSQALFACTKCMSRHPFEELSQGLQLCKECRGAFPIVKCTYCRTEFQQESKSNLSPICKKCEHNVKQYGKPSPCEYCNIIAAFIGSKCQRCSNSEKKYGPPLNCDQCKQRCAFDRDAESRRKVDGKLLCWLCTLSYKRALAKARQNESSVRHTSIRDHHRSSRQREHRSHSSGRQGSSFGNQSHHSSERDRDAAAKKARLDLAMAVAGGKSSIGSNAGLTDPFASISTSAFIGSNGSTHTSGLGSISDILASSTSQRPMGVATLATADRSEDFAKVNQLQTEVQRLQKQIKTKEQELLNKDKIIADLKAKNSREQHEMRDKLNIIHKKHDERIQELTNRIQSLQKQNATLAKAQKLNSAANAIKPATPNASPPV